MTVRTAAVVAAVSKAENHQVEDRLQLSGFDLDFSIPFFVIPHRDFVLNRKRQSKRIISCMKKVFFALFATFVFLIPLVNLALEPTSPGIRANRKDSARGAPIPSAIPAKALTIEFWYQSPTTSLGLVDAITGAVEWQPLQNFRMDGSSDTLFPCRFAFRCSIGNRVISYCNVMTDNRAAYRMKIDVNGLTHVSIDGPGRQSLSFEAEGHKKRIEVYGRTGPNSASCGIRGIRP